MKNLLMCLFLTYCVSVVFPYNITNGNADLSDVDFFKINNIPLNGEWEMIWKDFAEYEDFDLVEPLIVNVPDDWNKYRLVNPDQTPYGYATFRLRIKLPHDRPRIGIYISNASTSYELFVNNIIIGNDGKPGITKDAMIPSEKPGLFEIPNSFDEFYLTVKVSNFYHPTGGLWESVRIGNYEKQLKVKNINLYSEILICGALLFICLYHFFLYLQRRKEPGYLFIALGALMVGIRIGLSGEHTIFYVIPELYGYYEFFKRAVVVNFSLSMITLFLIFFDILNRLKDYIFRSFIVGSLIITILMSLLPYFYGYRVSSIYTYVVIFMMIYTVVLLVIHTVRRKKFASVYMAGFLILGGFIANDILSTILLINSGIFLIPYGVLAFLLLHSVILSRRFILAFNEAEQLKMVLEQKVADRTMQLRLSNEAKDTMFSIISHDLRGPVGSITNLIKLINKDYTNITDDKKQKLLFQLQNASNSTYNLLDNILLWSRTQLNEININKENVDIGEILEQEIKNVNNTVIDKNISLNKSIITVIVNVDKNMISVAIRNILSNALKYSNHNSSIDINVIKDHDKCIVTITDYGKGISPDRLERIFEPYKYKSTPGTAGETGSGLGLVISKRFLEMNNGIISYSSEQGKRTIVEIRFKAVQ